MAQEGLDKSIRVRVGTADMDKIRTDAKALGFTVSEYMRALAQLPMEVRQSIGSPTDDPGIVIYNKRLYAEFLRLIRYWGYHYNQCLHALNIIAAKKFMYPEDAAEMFGHAMVKLDEIDDTRARIEERMEQIARADRILANITPAGSDVADVRRAYTPEETRAYHDDASA